MPRVALRIARTAILAAIASAFVASVPCAPAVAQAASVSADFRVALEPFGAWRHVNRFGDVWVPTNRSRNWRPYTVGHWIYTDDYGWYWVADDQEADWGWITYHYGRWYRDPDIGWFWVPSDVWAPAWVDWRSGEQYVGWAPQPPDDVVVAVDDDPAYWNFVATSDLVAPGIAAVILPAARIAEVFRRTELVNRTVLMRGLGRHFAVNPGVPSSYVANAYGRPLRSYQVRPRVLAGTAPVPGAVQVRAEDLRRQSGNRSSGRGNRFATSDIIRPSSTIVRPGRSVLPPQALARGEFGRLGDAPPRAARGLTLEQRVAQGAASQRAARPPSEQGRRNEQRRGATTAAPTVPPQTTEQTPPQRRETTATRQQQSGARPASQGSVKSGPVASAPQRPSRPPPDIARPRPAPPPAMTARPAPARTAAPPPPRAAAASPPRPAAPPPRATAAPRPAAPPPPRAAAAPPRPAAPPPRAMAAPPPPAMPRAAAASRAPMTTGAAPHAGPPPRRSQ